jgi:hypothetical protein
MTLEERIADVEQRRDAFQFRLQLIMASAIPPRVKTMRIRAITKEIVALKHELLALIADLKRP